MRRGRQFPQVLPRAISRGLHPNYQLPTGGKLQLANILYNGHLLFVTTPYEQWFNNGDYNIAWQGTLVTPYFTGTWFCNWSFDPSAEDNHVSIVLSDGLYGVYDLEFDVAQDTGFAEGFNPSFVASNVQEYSIPPFDVDHQGPHTLVFLPQKYSDL